MISALGRNPRAATIRHHAHQGDVWQETMMALYQTWTCRAFGQLCSLITPSWTARRHFGRSSLMRYVRRILEKPVGSRPIAGSPHPPPTLFALTRPLRSSLIITFVLTKSRRVLGETLDLKNLPCELYALRRGLFFHLALTNVDFLWAKQNEGNFRAYQFSIFAAGKDDIVYNLLPYWLNFWKKG